MLPGPQAQQGQKTKIAWEPGQHHSALGPPQHQQSLRSLPRDPAAPAGGAPADAGTGTARKSSAGRDETGAGPPAPDTGEGRDAERDAVRAAASLRDGTREPGKPPMRVRPKPQDCPAGTAPTEQRGVGCPPIGAGPDRTPTDAPPPAASTDCARSAGCASPGAGDAPPPGASTDCASPAGCAGPGTGEVAPPPPMSPARRWATPPPPWPGGTSWKHRNSDTRSSPNQTQAEAEAGPQEPERHKEKATCPSPHHPRRAKQDEDGPLNPQSPQKPTGLRPPAHRPEAGRGTPHRTKTQTPPPPHPRQKSFPGNSEGYKSQTPPKAPHISSTAPAAVPHLECNRQKGPP
uniref:splicing factor, proline- and glutamine-rich-like n=1 Tax=Agelaius phoeniceus TaxID=39638 RepID=UPI0023EC8BB6|nr:splicing factor, proline- and glutamine-rich-like [Agelaius phoeniceus]